MTMEKHAVKGIDHHVRFVSLGMIVLDELHLPDGTILYDSIGGSGAWSTCGARLVSGLDRARHIACFVRAGNDFPVDAIKFLDTWGIQSHVVTEHTKASTRGLLEYHDQSFGRRSAFLVPFALLERSNDLKI